MKDRRGVDRGFCKECGESECAEYELPPDERKIECHYCSCSPVKHVKKETTQNSSSGTHHHDFLQHEKAVESNPQGRISDEKGETSSDPVLAMASALNGQSTGPDFMDATQEDSLSDHHVSFSHSASVDPSSPLCSPPVHQDTFSESPVTTLLKHNIKEMVETDRIDNKCQPLQVACLGRPFRLGCLYDRGTDRLISGIMLWSEEELRRRLKVSTLELLDSEVIVEDSISGKAAILDVDASLELSFLSGLVNISGWPS
ncbi:unnamed protein product [Darwinula stevensoni]|uniref:Uncharacterized protein n=1 Tax=Darwinula stevensoni TaxID=69355 RepID=A0A7R8ZXA4_9CRUS|nr:unnamed protein product [Darwinula stevensoni]CAG0878964.1 unnamed protein product [Darwinula stevensoni]